MCADEDRLELSEDNSDPQDNDKAMTAWPGQRVKLALSEHWRPCSLGDTGLCGLPGLYQGACFP